MEHRVQIKGHFCVCFENVLPFHYSYSISIFNTSPHLTSPYKVGQCDTRYLCCFQEGQYCVVQQPSNDDSYMSCWFIVKQSAVVKQQESWSRLMDAVLYYSFVQAVKCCTWLSNWFQHQTCLQHHDQLHCSYPTSNYQLLYWFFLGIGIYFDLNVSNPGQ